MADSDDKTQDGAHKKTLTLKGGASAGMRPGMSRGPQHCGGRKAHPRGAARQCRRPAPPCVPRTPVRPPGLRAPAIALRAMAAARRVRRRRADAPRNPGLSTPRPRLAPASCARPGPARPRTIAAPAEAEARRAEEDARRREIREAADPRRCGARRCRAKLRPLRPSVPLRRADGRASCCSRAVRVAIGAGPHAGADRRPAAPGRPPSRWSLGPATAVRVVPRADRRPGGPSTGARPGGFDASGWPSTGARPGGFSRPGGPAPVPNMPAPPSEADGRRTRTTPPVGRPSRSSPSRSAPRRGPGPARASQPPRRQRRRLCRAAA